MSKIYSCPAERDIVNAIAKDLGTTIEQVMQVVSFQKNILKETMEKGSFEGVRFIHLGKFTVNQRRLKAINNKQYYELIHGKGEPGQPEPGNSEN